jgi:hypothetical protein
MAISTRKMNRAIQADDPARPGRLDPRVERLLALVAQAMRLPQRQGDGESQTQPEQPH